MNRSDYIIQRLLEDNETPRIRGEYWITDSGVWYADGDVGDFNHEMYARDHAVRRILDLFNAGSDEEFYDEDMFRTAIIEALGEEGVEADEKNWADLARDHIRRTVQPDKLKEMEACFDAACGFGDARDIAVQYFGWIWVRNNNLSIWTYDRDYILSGIGEVIEQEGDIEVDWNLLDLEIFVASTKKRYSVTYGELESGRTPGHDPTWPVVEDQHSGIFMKQLDNGRKVYSCKCPVCGNIHGGYKTYGEAHTHRKCREHYRKEVEKLRKDVEKVDKPKKQKNIFQNRLNKPPHPAAKLEDQDVEAIIMAPYIKESIE
jgi:hypothetical protein